MDLFDQIKPQAEAGVAQAQFDLAMLYSEGLHGAPKDSREAVLWMRQAAVQELPVAMWQLGVWCENGIHVPPDASAGRALMVKAAEAGWGEASLGLYYRTLGDPEQSSVWLEKAVSQLRSEAEAGNERAAINLGQLFLRFEAEAGEWPDFLRWVDFLAERGHPGARMVLGLKLLQGREVPKDKARAHSYIRQAAKFKVAGAEALSQALEQVEIGDFQDFSDYIGDLEEKAQRDIPEAQAALGLLFLHGLGIERSPGQARRYLRAAAEQGNVVAQFALGRIYYGEPPMYIGREEALRWLLRAAEQGLIAAQYDLGLNYQRYFLNRELRLAQYWYEKAGEAGHTDAQLALASLYDSTNEFDGLSEKDDTKAFFWYRRAAEQGNPNGQLMVARMFEAGRGVRQDYNQALDWYRRAAGDGDSDYRTTDSCGPARVGVGRLFEGGLGVAQDYEEAVRWYRRAAEEGDEEANLHLGRMYEFGRGVVRDLKEAARLYAEAAKEEWYWHEPGNEVTKEAIVRLGRLEKISDELSEPAIEESYFRSLYKYYEESWQGSLD